jgi:hypothetical protein
MSGSLTQRFVALTRSAQRFMARASLGNDDRSTSCQQIGSGNMAEFLLRDKVVKLLGTSG